MKTRKMKVTKAERQLVKMWRGLLEKVGYDPARDYCGVELIFVAAVKDGNGARYHCIRDALTERMPEPLEQELALMTVQQMEGRAAELREKLDEAGFESEAGETLRVPVGSTPDEVDAMVAAQDGEVH